MTKYEYRVIAAPSKGLKTKGISSAEARFSHALEEMMNTMARDGWEYQRAETLPSTERSGLTGSTTTWRNVLVFRRALPAEPERAAPVPEILKLRNPLMIEPAKPEPTEEPAPAPLRAAVPPVIKPQFPEDDASQSEGASRMLQDNGVEELSEVSGISSSLRQLAASRNASTSED